MERTRKKVLVAMSGGVDSSAAAYLLKKDGYDVSGASMRLWKKEDCPHKHNLACCSDEALESAAKVAAKIGIPFRVFDFSNEFDRIVIEYFKREYLTGRTPNPCIVCNEKIKFGLFLQKALESGMDFVATGHYARIDRNRWNRRYILRRGLDKSKDQSYVLFALKQEQMRHILLPLGRQKKSKIRKIAKDRDLGNHNRLDSQEICFVEDNDYVGFLKRRFSVADKEGFIKNRLGEVLGRHKGYFNYTIGQRRGLGIGHKEPLYVIDLDSENNEVIVGTKKEVYSRKFEVENVNWIIRIDGKDKIRAKVKVRSMHKSAPARIFRKSGDKAKVDFLRPQEAITPGQAAVFYSRDKVLGGGWIKKKLD